MDPNYNGTRPRMAVWHGVQDGYVNYWNNFEEEIKQWTGVLGGLKFARNNTNTPEPGYTQMVYGNGTKFVAYSAEGVGHPVPAHETVDLTWFGIS